MTGSACPPSQATHLMVGTALCTFAHPTISGSLRYLAKGLADRQHGVPDQVGILDRRLAMFDRFAVDGIPDHFRKCRNARIFGDEARIPALFGRPHQHQLDPPLPDNLSAEPLEHRAALPAIRRIGLRAGCLAAIGIGRLLAEPDQIEHVDGPGPVIGPELREDFPGRIDVAHAISSLKTGSLLLMVARAAARPNPALTFREPTLKLRALAYGRRGASGFHRWCGYGKGAADAISRY